VDFIIPFLGQDKLFELPMFAVNIPGHRKFGQRPDSSINAGYRLFELCTEERNSGASEYLHLSGANKNPGNVKKQQWVEDVENWGVRNKFTS
jgi:hypothetical protein